MIVSVSGVRGILNRDITLEDVSRFAGNFASMVGSREVLLARDSRSTGPAMARAAAAGLMSRGSRVIDYGIISTPALFRESRVEKKPAVMVTASHNEPEFNGLKFIDDGVGIGKNEMEALSAGEMGKAERFGPSSVRQVSRTRYAHDLVERFGAGSCEGVRVVLDLGGGAAISHSVQVLERLGCDVLTVNDAYGVFNRKVDPVADELLLLRKLVKARGFDLGLGFDCDGDRLVVVDSEGRKRTGDYMLTLALSELLAATREKKVVVSLDTTQAVEEVVGKAGGVVYRSKVGEANVVEMMKDKGARLGGEGSSGGLIDGAFNHCRDSMLAALVIIKALKVRGRSLYGSVPAYHQERVALTMSRTKAFKGIGGLARRYRGADLMDGVKVKLSRRSWVLVRPSGTENSVRVSAEAETSGKAAQLVRSFSAKLKELSR